MAHSSYSGLLSYCIFLAFLIVSFSSSLSSVSTQWNQTDRLSLLALKSGIEVDTLGALSSWNDSLHHCDWLGITCSHRHPERVTHLDLSSLKLAGILSPYIGNLTFLRQINVSENNFYGQIPQEISQLFRLQNLYLSNNSFSGSIPRNITHCRNLLDLFVDGNKLSGDIFPEISSLSKLEYLSLSINDFTGDIPSSLGNLTSLVFLSLARNHLDGNIPAELCCLQRLSFFQLGDNNITGRIPSCLYNFSHMGFFGVAANHLTGRLPSNLSLTLPNIRAIYFAGNRFEGAIPTSLSNATRLQTISFDQNYFTGSVPEGLGGLQYLSNLWVNDNQLGTNYGDDLNFLTSLINCSFIESIDIHANSLKGLLPNSISNLSASLREVLAGENQIIGSIPVGVGSLINIERLYLSGNSLTGDIPSSVGNLVRLQHLGIHNNFLSGKIPDSLGNLTHLSRLLMHGNALGGSIPPRLGNCKSLVTLVIALNNLVGTVPKELTRLSLLRILRLNNNSLTGSLPSQLGGITDLSVLDVSGNKLIGQIPESLGDCLNLQGLYMQHNFFQGELPKSLSALRGLEDINLSENNFSGEIPEYLEKLPLLGLNLAFNQLEGRVPSFGIFENVSAISIVGNKKLCGGIPELKLPHCSQKRKKKLSKKVIVATIAGFACLLVLLCVPVMWFRRFFFLKKKPSSTTLLSPYMRVSYSDLLKATNGFSNDNLIGVGSYGSVFKGFLQEVDQIIAVKVFNLPADRASKSFKAECNVLRNLRHRNLVKIITSCSSMDFQGNDFKALVFDFMENGSLQDWLHTKMDMQQLQIKTLSLTQRLSIAFDVASALEYLHHSCESEIIHCDLKPSNVLLDDHMVAHVADFGIAKIFSATLDDSTQSLTSSLIVKGSIGYIAPEYGMGDMVSIQGDVYSYGILVLEMFTRFKPTDVTFQNGLNLHTYAKMALPDDVTSILDPTILFEENGKVVDGIRPINIGTRLQECLVSIIRLGVVCSNESPVERMTMVEVVAELLRIKRYHESAKNTL